MPPRNRPPNPAPRAPRPGQVPLSFERRVAVGAAAVLGALALLWLLWPSATWAVTVEANETEVTPWRAVELVARVTPPDAVKAPLRWAWTTDGAPFEGEGPAARWRSGSEGAHAVEVSAVAADGVKHTARVVLSVHPRAFVGIDGTLTAPPPAASAPAAEDASAPLPFGIADIWVEKSDVCQGEPTRIRVTPFDKRGEQKWLRPNINNEQSWEVSYVPRLVAPGLQQVPITVTDDKLGRSVVQTFVYINVKDCIAPYPVLVEFKSIPPDEEYIAFSALVFRGPEWQAWARSSRPDRGGIPLARPAAFVWDFGDGTSGSSTEPRINHRYPAQADRPNERFTSYKAKLEVMDGRGQKMGTAQATVTFLNSLRLLARDDHTLQLVTQVAPGPAPTDTDGRRAVDVTLRNIDPNESARISELRARFIPCDGKDSTERLLPVASVFRDASVPAGGSLSGRLTVSSAELEGFCAVSVQIVGASSPGELRVVGFFGLDAGKRTGETLTLEQAAVFEKALELVGDASVIPLTTIQRLEDEGKLPKGVLTPEPFAPAR